MKFTFIILAFVFSVGSWAQTYTDPCNSQNLQQLLAGVENGFHSRIEANNCLKKAKDTGSPVKATQVDGKQNTWGFEFKVGEKITTRYLKLNKKDFFLTNTLLGKYKANDTNRKENKAMNKTKFIPAECIEFSTEICSRMNPPQDFDGDYCKCVDKDAVYCGDKNWSFEKKDKSHKKCDEREDHVWDDTTCECSKEKFCGVKEWSKNKKESEAESCLGKKGTEWDDESCLCTEIKYCAEKKWSLKKLEKEESGCSEKKNHVWNPDTCSCDTDTNTTVMCKGKPVDALKMKDEERRCEEKSTNQVHYSWDEIECRCDKEKMTVICSGETVGQAKHDRKKQRCMERQAKDDRWSWDEDQCDCIKKEDPEDHPLCGERKMSQRKIDRKKSRCDGIKGEWDPQTCKCKDPCYEVEEWKDEKLETCTDTVPKLGDVAFDDLGAKVCEKAIPDAEKAEMKKQCKEKVEEAFKQSPDQSELTPIEIEIDYTFKGQVLCAEKIVAVNSKKEIQRALPPNVPTTDPKAFSENCPATLKGDLYKYRNKVISCDQMEQVKGGYAEILKAANIPFDEFFTKLNIVGQISAQEMDKLLETSIFNLEVIGTANRSNNGTGITLYALALKRKQEAERIIRAELIAKIQSKVAGGTYVVKNTEKLITYNGGISQAVGPLNPKASSSSMHKVLAEAEAPAELKKCATGANGKPATDTKMMYACSVNFFVDKECPTLARVLHNKLCDGSSEELKIKLMAYDDVEDLEEYKMFQVGVGMSTETMTPVYGDVGTITVKCSAGITTEDVSETTTTITEMLKVTKPGFFRRMKKDCREERKILNEKYGRKNVRKAANHRKNPGGIVIGE